MVLWMSSEEMADLGDATSLIENEIEARINELIKDCKLGDYKKWCLIVMVLDDRGPDWNERVRRSLKDKILEFRLKIDYDTYANSSFEGKKKLVIKLLLKSLDLMHKWKDIKKSEINTIKEIISNEYKGLLESEYDNELIELDLHGLTKLVNLNVNRNKLSSIDITGCTSLEKLNISNNDISTLAVKKEDLANLFDINVSGNNLNKATFKTIFDALPDRTDLYAGSICLYITKKSYNDRNFKNFTTEELDTIKAKNWKVYYLDENYNQQFL